VRQGITVGSQAALTSRFGVQMIVLQISALPATTSSAQFPYGLHRLLPVQTVGKLRARRFPTGDCEGEGDRGGEGWIGGQRCDQFHRSIQPVVGNTSRTAGIA